MMVHVRALLGRARANQAEGECTAYDTSRRQIVMAAEYIHVAAHAQYIFLTECAQMVRWE